MLIIRYLIISLIIIFEPEIKKKIVRNDIFIRVTQQET